MDKNYQIARNLRKNSTPQEQKMWNMLRNRQFLGLKFKRQVPIYNYIADFVCEEKKIIIEIDGGQHNEPDNIDEDKKRTKILEEEGYQVIRFWNNEIDNNIEGVYQKLIEVLS